MNGLLPLLSAIADPVRLRILARLFEAESCVSDLCRRLKVAQPVASRHLGVLRKAGLVDTRREGLWIHYRLASLPDPLVQEAFAGVVLAAAAEGARQRAQAETPAARSLPPPGIEPGFLD
jgi:ArsR family transcriptional regulator